MRAPAAVTISGVNALTEPAVPTGTKAGVSTVPCAVVSTPARALPSVAVSRNISGRSRRFAAFEQASVPIGVEPIARADGVAIGSSHALGAGEGAGQHEQCRARQVEIGEQQVDRLEA